MDRIGRPAQPPVVDEHATTTIRIPEAGAHLRQDIVTRLTWEQIPVEVATEGLVVPHRFAARAAQLADEVVAVGGPPPEGPAADAPPRPMPRYASNTMNIVLWTGALLCWIIPLTVVATPALLALWWSARRRGPITLAPLVVGLIGSANAARFVVEVVVLSGR